MKYRAAWNPIVRVATIVLLLTVMPRHAKTQGTVGQAPQSARASAPIDLTGYWIPVITEDWRWRMVTPARGDYSSVPLNEEGQRVADSWDPFRDEENGNQCRGYGAAAIMRAPGRVRITWENELVLKIETEAGVQTRLLRFVDAPAPVEDGGWQGYSIARWENPVTRGATGGRLTVRTTAMRPGYLRKNGVPYSADAVVTEYFEAFVDDEDGTIYLIVTNVVEDPQYLTRTFVTSTHFKKLADGSPWTPTRCSAN